MQSYGNLSGDSGVLAYEIGRDYIRVQFRNGTYLYDYGSTGQQNIEEMKILATRGRGLNTFIDKYVRKKYASKSKF